MKKILTVSLVAMMAVSAAHADLASTAYVDTVAAAEASAAQAAAEAKVTALTEGAVATNTADIATNAAQIALKANQADLATLQGTVNTLGDTYALDSELESAVTSLKNTEIKAAADAAAAAQTTADGAVEVNTAQQTAIEANAAQIALKANQADLTALQNTVNDTTSGLAATKAIADQNKTNIATNKADIDAINGGANGIAGMVVSGNPTEGAGKYALTAIVNENNVITGYKWEFISR